MELFGLRIRRAKKKQPKAPAQEAQKVEEVPIEQVPGKVPYQIVRQKDRRTIVVKKGKIRNRREFLIRRYEGEKRSFYPDHIIKETRKGKDRYFVRWNLYTSEAYTKEGELKHDPDLEQLLRNSRKIQLIKAVPSVAGLQIDRTMTAILLLAMVFGIPIGLSFNDIFHWVPNTVVHWIPRT